MHIARWKWGKIVRGLFGSGLVLVLFVLSGMPALAYINRGTVAVSLGETSAQVAAGQTVAISATLTPASHDELPGCGMSYCPQQCSAGCMNRTGDCACNGMKYTTYKAGMTLTSANTSVAAATYADGVITVTGRAAGQTTITVVGTLRQYSSSKPQKIQVTVTGNGSTGAVSGAQGGETASASSSALPTADPAAVQTITGQLGTFDFLEIAPGKTGKAELTAIKGKNRTATFEKKDASGNVAYAWSFLGTDVTDPVDMDFGISFSSKEKKAMQRAGTLIEPFYLSFTHEGTLPGKATVNVNTGSYYPAGTTLYLYMYSPQSKKLELTGGNVKLENGYASFSITHCSDYVLVAKPIAARAAVPLPAVAAFCAVAAAAVAGGIMFFLLRRRPTAPAVSKPEKETQP